MSKTQRQMITNIPWYLDTCNMKEVIVKDSYGNIVHYEDLGSIPDEWNSSMREKAIAEAHANARLMVTMSEVFAKVKCPHCKCTM